MVRLRPIALAELAARVGGELRGVDRGTLEAVAPVGVAGAAALAPVLTGRFVEAACAAAARGAVLLVDGALAADRRLAALPAWIHPRAAWALAELLDAYADAPEVEPVIGPGARIGANVVLGPRVVVGEGVTLGANSVIGRPGFGWAEGEGGATRAVPQLGGVVIEDGAVVGPLCTIDAGTLAPTRVARGAKLDAQVHVGHNTVIGEGTIVAAQSGFAGSVRVGRGVRIGGQVGVADHVTIGDGARIAAKSGVIGDVPPGTTYAGYPAVPRGRWLRALAWLHRAAERT